MGRASSGEPVETTLSRFLAAQGIPVSTRLAVAYSGGPDSAALLAAAAAVRPEAPVAVHVVHGLRPADESARELELVKATCRSLGAPLLVARIRSGAIARRARESGEGIEAQARRARYRAFQGALARVGAAVLLLAHTRDDEAEGILMRLLSGSGAAGLAGMAPRRGPYLRPLLGLDKAELLEYLATRGLAYSSDSSNEDESLLRNRVRKRLVPLLDGSFPGWRSGLAATARRASSESAALDAMAEAAGLVFRPRPDGTLAVALPAFDAAPPALRLRALLGAFGRLNGGRRASRRMAQAAIEALGRGGGAYRGGGLVVASGNGELSVSRMPAASRALGLDFPRRGGYFVVIERPRRIELGSLIVEAAWTGSESGGILRDAFRFPLVIRSRKPGDSIAIPGGEKRVDELLSEWGMDARSRAAVPIVEDRDGIVAVLGAGFGARDRFRARPAPMGPPGPRLSVTVKGA